MWGPAPSQASLNIGHWCTDTREAWALSSIWMGGWWVILPIPAISAQAWGKASSLQSRSWGGLTEVSDNLYSSSSLRLRTLCRVPP